jgi:hypothetical protein
VGRERRGGLPHLCVDDAFYNESDAPCTTLLLYSLPLTAALPAFVLHLLNSSCSDGLAGAVLGALSAWLLDSPGSQAALHGLGITARLLALLRLPSHSPSFGLDIIRALGLLASRRTPDAQAQATAGGLVAVVMNVLQQQALAGVLVSEVLPRMCCANHSRLCWRLSPLCLPDSIHPALS